MSLSSAEERALAELEQELAGDDTLSVLAERMNRLPRHRKRLRLPLPWLGWTIMLLMSGLGIALLVAGLLTGKPAGIAAAGVLALLFQLPLVTLIMLTRGRRPCR